MKRINPTMKETAMNELKILCSLDHPNIIKVYGYIQVKEQDIPILVMHYTEKETLDKYLFEKKRNINVSLSGRGCTKALIFPHNKSMRF